MENVKIIESTNKTFIVKADTERFGIQQILFESYKFQDCLAFLKEHGVVYDLEMALKANNSQCISIGRMIFHKVLDGGLRGLRPGGFNAVINARMTSPRTAIATMPINQEMLIRISPRGCIR